MKRLWYMYVWTIAVPKLVHVSKRNKWCKNDVKRIFDPRERKRKGNFENAAYWKPRGTVKGKVKQIKILFNMRQYIIEFSPKPSASMAWKHSRFAGNLFGSQSQFSHSNNSRNRIEPKHTYRKTALDILDICVLWSRKFY